MLDVIVVVALLLVAVALAPIWPFNREWGKFPAVAALVLLASFVTFWYVIPIR